MSKKCPYCGSYNTEVSLGNFAGRAIVNTGRAALALGVGIVGGFFGHSVGHAATHSVWHNTDPGEFKGYHCCNCGKDFKV